jgi:hypothetical protein
MSLVSCRECSQQVSDKAKTCPHCGIDDPAGTQSRSVSVRTREPSLAMILLALLAIGVAAEAMGGVALWIGGVAFFVLGIGIYFLPAFIASERRHPNRYSIFIINLFFGWTFVGWVACLAWALSNKES